MVNDIKNNEGGIMNKIKKLKVKAPPSVPRRDYALESPADEEEQWSDDFDSDYENPDDHSDSEMYVMPAEENGDDSYEPPPVEQETRRVHPALPFPRGEYVDNRSSQRQSPPSSKTLPNKLSWPSAKTRLSSTLLAPRALPKPQVPPKPRDLHDEDGSFLIRKSSGHDSKQPYTLVVFFNKRVYNIPVRFIEATKQYALGRKKNGEEYFGSVAEIIKNHQHSPLVLIDSQNNTKDSTRLKYAVNIS
ncbi:B-cell linker protein [Heterocephalus glaber]|uniref:B-cell linker protein n=1 Tax=Heterocephalus glaber TaxID=10181 RepID=G5AW17_HETGA|nr:B-cell linker protein [Heterocephalus glaber]